MAATMSPEREARATKVAELYDGQGLSYNAIARELAISVATVHKDLKTKGIQPRPLGEAISAARQAKFAAQRESRASAAGARESRPPGCATVPEVERDLGVPQWCIRGWIKGGLLELVPDTLHDEIVRLRKSGLSMQAIADQMGIKVRVVQLRLEGTRRADLVRVADVERLIAEPHLCEGCGQPVEPGRSWHPWCAGNREDSEAVAARKKAFAESSAERLKNLHEELRQALDDAGLVSINHTAQMTLSNRVSVYEKFEIERVELGPRFRVGVNAKAVVFASPDKHARSKLNKQLSALNGTDFGRPPIQPELNAEIRRLGEDGMSFRQIEAKLGVSKSHIGRVLAAAKAS